MSDGTPTMKVALDDMNVDEVYTLFEGSFAALTRCVDRVGALGGMTVDIEGTQVFIPIAEVQGEPMALALCSTKESAWYIVKAVEAGFVGLGARSLRDPDAPGKET